MAVGAWHASEYAEKFVMFILRITALSTHRHIYEEGFASGRVGAALVAVPNEHDLLSESRAAQLNFAILLKAFQLYGRFPEQHSDIAESVIVSSTGRLACRRGCEMRQLKRRPGELCNNLGSILRRALDPSGSGSRPVYRLSGTARSRM